jgi:hypothetical protein
MVVKVQGIVALKIFNSFIFLLSLLCPGPSSCGQRKTSPKIDDNKRFYLQQIALNLGYIKK